MKSYRIALAVAAVGAGFAGAAEAQIEHARTPVEPASEQAGAAQPASQTVRTGGLYAGIGWATIWADDGMGDTAVLGAIQARVGYDFSQYFAIEAEAAIGVLPQEYEFSGFDVDLNLDREVGVFAVARAPVSPDFALYARVGFARTTVSASAGGYSFSEGDSGLAYGLGLDWRASPTFGSRFEIANYTFGAGGDAFAFQTSIMGYF